MIVVLVVAAGAAWETPALAALGDHPQTVVLKRCVDVDDLLATAASGQAQAAVVGLSAQGLDAGAVADLRRHGVRPVVVADDGPLDAAQLRAGRLGVTAVVRPGEMAGLPDVVTTPEADRVEPTAPRVAPADPSGNLSPGALPTTPPPPTPPGAAAPVGGRAIVVWGPGGAPGRSTVAAALAAENARRGRRTVLVDADPYGGTLAQQLGVMDEVSGLLSAARLATSGQLAERLASVQRALDGRLSLVSGLPRADRWAEVRDGAIELLVELACERADVVVDTGFGLESDPVLETAGRPGRNALTLGALAAADAVVVVGTADPIGLSRLARGLAELGELDHLPPGVPLLVAVNRMRATLGWSEREIAGMVAGFAPLAGLRFLPDDRAAVDRALVRGRTLHESGDSPLVKAVAGLADDLAGVSSRTAGTARPR